MTSLEITNYLKTHVRDVPDFPKPGILFRDVTPVLANTQAWRIAVRELVRPWIDRVDSIAAIESRGFLFGAAASRELDVPLHLLRKPGKLPPPFVEEKYTLEYGTDALQLRGELLKLDAKRVLIVDDVIATGGTALAAASLLQQCGVEPVGVAAFIDLPFLGGSGTLRGRNISVTSVLTY